MVENEDIIPLDLTGQNLDFFLELGYYRMRQTIFTTDEFFDSETEMPYDCFWLRTRLSLVDEVKTHKIYKLNKRFSIQIGPAIFDTEMDELYERYRGSMKFDAHESVFSFLLDSEKMVEFNSMCIQIRDGETLIAGAYFDEGQKTIMGNLNFYHPDYKKYSLGKYMMLLKIAYAKQKNLDFYYTGYIALNNTKFDYKLFPKLEAIEVLLKKRVNAWFPYASLGKEGLEANGGHWVHLNEGIDDQTNGL